MQENLDFSPKKQENMDMSLKKQENIDTSSKKEVPAAVLDQSPHVESKSPTGAASVVISPRAKGVPAVKSIGVGHSIGVPSMGSASGSKWRMGPSTIGASFLVAYPWYEGPNPPLGFAYYNARWQATGLDEPFYAMHPTPETKRRWKNFFTKVYGLLTINAAIMTACIGMYDLFTRKNDVLDTNSTATTSATNSYNLVQKRHIRMHHGGFFVAATCISVTTLIAALIFSNWRRKHPVRNVITPVYAIFTCLFATTIALGIDVDDPRLEVHPRHVVYALVQFTVTLLLVLLFSLQKWIEMASWPGFIIVVALNLAPNFVLLLLYDRLLPNQRYPGVILFAIFVVLANLIYLDLRRMLRDKRLALIEKEYVFAVFQLQVDVLYLPWYVWELNRHLVRRLVGKLAFVCGRRKPRRGQPKNVNLKGPKPRSDMSLYNEKQTPKM